MTFCAVKNSTCTPGYVDFDIQYKIDRLWAIMIL